MGRGHALEGGASGLPMNMCDAIFLLDGFSKAHDVFDKHRQEGVLPLESMHGQSSSSTAPWLPDT